MRDERFIIDRKLYDEFVERFAERTRAIKIGDPNDPETLIGPIINAKQLNGLRERIDEARGRRARGRRRRARRPGAAAARFCGCAQ